ncbi:PP2C family protein-serine/threonine phosphatase [Nocardioides ungokensis]
MGSDTDSPNGGVTGTPDYFGDAPCGYVVTNDDGLIVRANSEFLRTVQRTADDVISVRTLTSLLTVGGRIFVETHLYPMLRNTDVVREIDLDLVRPDGSRVPVLLNASLTLPGGGLALRAVVLEARDRHRYEKDLRQATRTAENALENAAALAQTLQQTLIPPAPPQIPHLDIAAAYRPAGNGREVGGDFYDVFQVSPSAWVVVVGDVSGKGIPAATVTSLVRYTVRSFAIEHPDPADLLHHVDAVLQANDTDRYCTLVVARLDRHDDIWELALGLAGHPPALLRTPDGIVTPLGVPGTPVGLVHDPHFHTVRHRLTQGTVTLYTDGVTEARGADGLYGEERLNDLIGNLPSDSRGLTEGIARDALDYQGGNASDDIAIVTFSPRS